MKYSEFIPYKIPFEDVDLDAYQDICHSYKVLARMKNIENTRIMVFDYISCGLSFYRDKDKAFIQQSDEAFHYIYHKEDLEQPEIKSSYRVWDKVLDMFSALPENEREFVSFIRLFHGKVSEVNISYVVKAMPLLYTRKGKVAMIILSIQTSVIQSTQDHCFFYNRAKHKGMVYRGGYRRMDRVFHNAFDAGGAGDCVAKQHGRVGKIDCGKHAALRQHYQ